VILNALFRAALRVAVSGATGVTEDLQRLFQGVRNFSWDPAKQAKNKAVHAIDFEDVRAILDGYTFIRRSDRYGEVRYQIFGYLEGQEVAVACTLNNAICHFISARRARRDERREYYSRVQRRSDPRHD
jgi:hypothetical protein